MKKIISAGLATILAASALSTAAFAEEFTMTAESVLAKPAIKVTMPKNMAFVFNPYKLGVDLKGKVDASAADATKAYVVPSYLFEKEAPANTGWLITNGTGADLQAAVYAYSVNKADAEFLVIDTSNSAKTPAEGSGKRALKLEITAGGSTVPVQEEALPKETKIWSVADDSAALKSASNTDKLAAKATLAAGTATEPGTMAVTMTGETVNPDSLIWSEKDAVKVNFVFAFEVKDPE